MHPCISYTLIHTDLSPQNLVARGEHQKPAVTGGSNANDTAPTYGESNHNVLDNQMDPSADGTTAFDYGAAGQQY